MDIKTTALGEISTKTKNWVVEFWDGREIVITEKQYKILTPHLLGLTKHVFVAINGHPYNSKGIKAITETSKLTEQELKLNEEKNKLLEADKKAEEERAKYIFQLKRDFMDKKYGVGKWNAWTDLLKEFAGKEMQEYIENHLTSQLT